MIFYKRNKYKEKTKWHIWFAWYPVIVDKTPDGDFKIIWWQNVYRCLYEKVYITGLYREYFYHEFIPEEGNTQWNKNI